MMSPHDRPPHDGTTANRRRLRPLGLALALTAALIALLWLAVGRTALAAPLAAPPEITGVTPGAAYNDRPTEITIAGVDFSAMPTVTLGTVLLEDVGFVDSETLTAVVPAGLPGGSYAVTVTNPDGESGSLPDAFTVLLAGDGSLGPWQPVESMQTPRVALSVVKADHFLYAVGGNNHGSLTSVERAEILPDGSLSPWQPVEAMTTARHSLATVYVRGHLYALGGYQYQGANLTLESVERAQVQPDGSLGPWELVAPMKKKRRDLAAVAAGEFVYAFGGGPFPQKSVERARINPDGSLGAWEIVSEMKRARTAPSAVVVGDYVYVLGGFTNASGPYRSVERAPILTNGALGEWEFAAPMVHHRQFPQAVVAAGYLYAIDGDGGIGSIERAPIRPDGSLGPWQVVSSLDADLGGFAAASSHSYVYLVGGIKRASSTVQNSVARAEINAVRIAALLPPGIPADRLAEIVVTGANFLPPPRLQLGNGISLQVSFVSSRTLTTTIPAGLARGHYSLILTNGDGRVVTRTDALFVDDTMPVGESIVLNEGAISSTVPEVAVEISASDPTDHVESVSFSHDGLIWEAWEPYQTSLTWMLSAGDGSKALYARFKDSVGNVSEAISDTIELDTAVGSDYGISINDGALFTNQTAVTLSIAAPAMTARMQVSNDGGFSGATWEPYASRKAWTITQHGNSVIPRVVYVRYQDLDDNTSATFQDDIILDVTPPTGTVEIGGGNQVAAASASVTLHLDASDDVSGIGGMRISNRADFAGAEWRDYATRVEWTLGQNQTVYVQFRDNAGNVSATSSASLGTEPTPTGTASPTTTSTATGTPTTATATPTVGASPTVTGTATPPRRSERQLYLPVVQR